MIPAGKKDLIEYLLSDKEFNIALDEVRAQNNFYNAIMKYGRNADRRPLTLHHAVDIFLIWGRTDEGYDYWYSVNKSVAERMQELEWEL